MKTNEKAIILIRIMTWIGRDPDAVHWFCIIENTENGQQDKTDGFLDKTDALLQAFKIFLSKYDVDNYVLFVGSKAALFSI